MLLLLQAYHQWANYKQMEKGLNIVKPEWKGVLFVCVATDFVTRGEVANRILFAKSPFLNAMGSFFVGGRGANRTFSSLRGHFTSVKGNKGSFQGTPVAFFHALQRGPAVLERGPGTPRALW